MTTLPDEDDLSLVASAARQRVNRLRLAHDRETAIERVRSPQSLTASWKPLGHDFLSAKAKLQPRDSKGRWIDMGATVRWLNGSQIGGDRHKLSGAHGGKSYSQGTVTGFDPDTKKYSIKPTEGGSSIQLEGKDLEVIKAVIPDSPDAAESRVSGKEKADAFGAPTAPDVDAPNVGPGAPKDSNGEEVKVGDKLDWSLGMYGGKEYPVVDITPDGHPVVKNPHVKNYDQLTTLAPKKSEFHRYGGDGFDRPTFTKALPDAPETPELKRAIEQMDNAARYAGFSNDGYDKYASGRESAFRDAAKILKKKGLTPEVVADLRSRGETSAHGNDNAGYDDHNPFHGGNAKGFAEAADQLDAMLPKGSHENAPEAAPAPDPRAAIAERTGLTDEEMKDAPEILPSVENLRRSVTDANFLSAKDLADFNEYLDEVQIAPGGRTAGQWDSIEEFLNDRAHGTIDDMDDFTNVLDTLDAARRDSLDSPGGDTIESLDKPAPKTALLDDLPDQTDNALTVPDDWAADPGHTATDDNGETFEIGDKVNWRQGDFGAKENTVVDISADGKVTVENKWGDRTVLGTRDEGKPLSVTKSEPDVEMTPEVKSVLAKLDNDARYAGFSNDGHDKAASGREGAIRQAIELVRKKGVTPDVVAELRRRAEQDSHKNDYSGYDDHNPYYDGSSKSYAKLADELEQRLPKTDAPANDAPAGNVTEFAKNMFQNLHPDQDWDKADQTTWLDAAKKAMEKKND